MTRRASERGSALILVVVLLTAMLGAGAVMLRLQVSTTATAGVAAQGQKAFYCAEAGLALGQTMIPARYGDWSDVLDGPPYPDWYPIRGDMDLPPDGIDDYVVTIEDNVDELPPLANDPTRDNDLSIMIVSECIKWPEYPKRIAVMVNRRTGTGSCDSTQKGAGCQGTSNFNR